MCLAAGVPLVESGTTGFNGQVQVIEKVNSLAGLLIAALILLTITGQNRMLRLQSKRDTEILSYLHNPH